MIWQILDEGFYKIVLFRGDQVFVVDDNTLDLRYFIEDLCNAEYSYEEAKDVYESLNDLLTLCEEKNIRVINTPPKFNREIYKETWNSIYG